MCDRDDCNIINVATSNIIEINYEIEQLSRCIGGERAVARLCEDLKHEVEKIQKIMKEIDRDRCTRCDCACYCGCLGI